MDEIICLDSRLHEADEVGEVRLDLDLWENINIMCTPQEPPSKLIL